MESSVLTIDAQEATSATARPASECAPHERCRVMLLTNEIPPYRVPQYRDLAAVPDWQFEVVTCCEREAGRMWNVENDLPFAVRRSYSFSYERRAGSPDATGTHLVRQVHLPVGLWFDLWKFKPDVIISAELGVRTLIATMYARLRKCPLLVYFEGTVYTERALTRGQRWMRWLIGRAPNGYLVNGIQGRQYVESLGMPSETITEIGQAIDTESFAEPPSAAERERRRQELAIEGQAFLYCGRLLSLKGLDQLLDAWARFIRQPGVHATLLLLGDGPEREKLEQRVSEAGITNVRFLGHLQRDELPAVYHASDVFVLPSLFDCWGLVVSEAMAAGLPVINSKYAGSSELILEGETGWLVDPLDADDLTNKLRLAWNARDRKASMGERAKELIARSSVSAVTERIRRAVDRLGISKNRNLPVASEVSAS